MMWLTRGIATIGMPTPIRPFAAPAVTNASIRATPPARVS